MENYYEEQLKKIDINSKENINIKICSFSGDTNYITLNKESIPVIINFLNKLNIELIEKEIFNFCNDSISID